MNADFRVSLHGSIALVHPITVEAQEWLDENVGEAQGWGKNAIVVEPRYLDNLIAGMQNAGLVQG